MDPLNEETVIARANGDLHVTDALGRMATLHWSRLHGLMLDAHQQGAVYLGQPEVRTWLTDRLEA